MIQLPESSATLKTDQDISRVISWCLSASCVNSCLNPFIYFYKFSKFRCNARKLFQKIGCSFLLKINRRSGRVNSMRQDPNQMETSRRDPWLVNGASIPWTLNLFFGTIVLTTIYMASKLQILQQCKREKPYSKLISTWLNLLKARSFETYSF